MERSSSICPTTGLHKGTWTAEEDAKLRHYVNQHGIPKRWSKVPAEAGLSRCRKSCRFRWKNYLDPIPERGNYTKEEDDLIIDLRKLGLGWAAIAKVIVERLGRRRTDCDIKNHWYTKLNKDPILIKEERKQGGPGGSKRVRVDQNNTTQVVFKSSENHAIGENSTLVILESSENQYIGENSTPVILESSALPRSLVSSTKSLPSTQNSEGSTSSPGLSFPTPNSDHKNALVFNDAIVDLGSPSKNPDVLVDPSTNEMTSSVLQEWWDLPIEDVEMLVSPSILPHTIENLPFCHVSSYATDGLTPQDLVPEKSTSSEEFSSLVRRVILRRKHSKFTSPVVLENSENQDIDENAQVTLQGSDEPPVSPTLFSCFSGGKHSSARFRREISYHVSPQEFSELTSPDEFSEEETSKFISQEEISESTSPEKFSCFTCLNSFVSLFRSSLNSLVSLCNFKKCN